MRYVTADQRRSRRLQRPIRGNNRDNTDAAALLLAVLVATVNPMVSEGAWELLDTIIAVVVALILWCFTWPRKGAHLSTRLAVAHALVYGLIAGTGAAWIAQFAMWSSDLTKDHCDDRWQPYSDSGCVNGDDELDLLASQATTAALIISAIVAVIVFAWLYHFYVRKRNG